MRLIPLPLDYKQGLFEPTDSNGGNGMGIVARRANGSGTGHSTPATTPADASRQRPLLSKEGSFFSPPFAAAQCP